MALWIESHVDLACHPKVQRLARKLGMTRPEALGHLTCLWHWAIQYAQDGDITEFEADEIASGAFLFDRPLEDTVEPDDFLKALIDTKWVDEDETGRRLHNWEKYTRRLIEARELAAVSGARGNHTRWHTDRGISDPSCNFCREESGAISGQESGGESQPDRGANRTVPNRTEPDLTQPHRTEPEVITPPFDDFWKRYPSRNGTKGSKKNAERAWKALSKRKRELALGALQAYARSANGYPKDAERYLRGELWDGLEVSVAAPSIYPDLGSA